MRERESVLKSHGRGCGLEMGIGSRIGYIWIHILTKFAKIANIWFQNGEITYPYFADRGGKLLRIYISRIPVKLDWNAFQTPTEVGFRPVEKAEHQGCCGRIPPESGRNRNPALDSGPQQTGMKTRMCHLVLDDECYLAECNLGDLEDTSGIRETY